MTKVTSKSTQPIVRITLSDVARAAGVDKSTASRALRDDASIGVETRLRIQQIAEQLHYVPNANAQRLSNARTNVIAFSSNVFRHGSEPDPFQLELLAVITREAAKQGFDVLLCRPEADPDNHQTFARILGGHHADGLILMDLRPADPRLDFLCARGFPHVLFGRSAEDMRRAQRYPFPWVEVDNRNGTKVGMAHLVGLGHSRIAFIGGDQTYICDLDRHAGYRDGLATAKLAFDPDIFLPGEVAEETGYTLTRQVLDLANPPTAIFACSDIVAVGAMRAARDLGRQVGRSFAVMGFDGLGLGNFLTPALTTLRQPMAQIGEQLVQQVISVVRGTAVSPPHTLLQPELVVRASTIGD